VVPANKLGVAYENVSFTTSDGLELEGWYVPSKNGAAVIAFPGRKGPQKPTRMLARHGYGVLLFDRRGEGRSEGEPNSWGWGGDTDIKAAIAFLQRRPDVERGRIGGIGLSVGGEMMLEAAADTESRAAVVAEGAGARLFTEEMDEDRPAVEKATIAVPAWLKQASIAVFSNQSPPTNLKESCRGSPRARCCSSLPPTPRRVRTSTAATSRQPVSRRRCGRSPSPGTSAGCRRDRGSTSGASSASSIAPCCSAADRAQASRLPSSAACAATSCA
jgi:alpha-beta hydrolase superfamily lysophospholipase